MNKLLALSVLIIMYLPLSVYAETVVLKSGEEIKGRIIEKTDEYLKLDCQGVPVTYFWNEIIGFDDSKDSQSPVAVPAPEAALRGQGVTDDPLAKRSVLSGIVEVRRDDDTKVLSQFWMDTLLPVILSCKGAAYQTMKQSGKSDEEIESILSDATVNKQLDKECLCSNKDKIIDKMEKLDALMARHPEWQGKKLVIKENNTTEEIDTEVAWRQVKETLLNCR